MVGSVALVRRFGLDVALWYLLPALFMTVYVAVFSEPTAAVIPHLSVLTLPLLLIVLARVLLARLVASVEIGRLLASVLIAALLSLLIVYYTMVLIGLASWGGVVSWEVIPSFFKQAEVAADLLHVATPFVDGAPVALFVVLTGAVRLYLARFDWAIPWAARVSNFTVVSVVAGGMLAMAVYGFDFSFGSATRVAEPISLTLFSSRAALALEGYTANPIKASQVDRTIDVARNGYKPSPSTDHRNLVLIVVDALRPDHMGVYGYERDTTPNISRITKQVPARIITGTHASCGDTACSMFSLFSSKFPSEFSFHPFFLHEALRRNGYRIHLVLSGDHTYFFGLKQYYGHVDSFYDGNESAEATYLNDDQQVVDRLTAMPAWDGRPVMFQFHLMSAHILRYRPKSPGPFLPETRYGLGGGHDAGPGGVPDPGAVNFYDNGVLKVDSIIASLLDTLESKGYLHNTLVVITADHGESLGEHGLFKHANSVREELLRIPLILLYYGIPPQVPERPREYPSQVDIAPTILKELELPIPAPWVGNPLQLPDKPQFTFFQEHAFAGVIDHRDRARTWKYWRDDNSGDEHVFELNSDPHEDHDLRDSLPPDRLTELRNSTREESSGLAVP
jgi:hypothetical protein